MAAKTKLTVYVPADICDEMKAEADRQDRNVSWMVEQAWRISRERIVRYPGVADLYVD